MTDVARVQDNFSPEQKTNVLINEKGAFAPRDLNQLWRLSQVMSASGLTPKGIDRPETVFVAIQMGLELGLDPFDSVRSIAVINGRPSLWGDAVLGLVQGSGVMKDFDEGWDGKPYQDDFFAWCLVTRDGRKPIRREFSVADAKAAGLWGKQGPWQQYPKRMLQMRARSWALKDGFPDVLRGIRMAEEVRDMDPIDVTPSRPPLALVTPETQQQARTEPITQTGKLTAKIKANKQAPTEAPVEAPPVDTRLAEMRGELIAELYKLGIDPEKEAEERWGAKVSALDFDTVENILASIKADVSDDTNQGSASEPATNPQEAGEQSEPGLAPQDSPASNPPQQGDGNNLEDIWAVMEDVRMDIYDAMSTAGLNPHQVAKHWKKNNVHKDKKQLEEAIEEALKKPKELQRYLDSLGR